MATNGLVTIRTNGKVKMKIIAGCDGYNAKKLAKKIRKLGRMTTIGEAYLLATECGFGCSRCLTAMDKTHAVLKSNLPLPKLYRSTFKDPAFNPRWECGDVEPGCLEIIDL